MIPMYMKEDNDFLAVWNYIEDIFKQINQTCIDMRNDLDPERNVNSPEYLKAMSIFGQTSTFKKDDCIVVYGFIPTDTGWTLIQNPEVPEPLNISLSKLSLYYSTKFNTIKNNFDGTFKSLNDSYLKVFSKDTGFIYAESEGDLEGCKQGIGEGSDGKNHTAITLAVTVAKDYSKQGLSIFPPEEAYLTPTEEYPYDIWDIRNLERPDNDWIKASEENAKMYNTYKDYCEVITLFQNGYFNLDILGVITSFEFLENVPILKWNNSKWNYSLWADKIISNESND